ncbi:hypothetical protein ES708_29526 [subsurface metagenome]
MFIDQVAGAFSLDALFRGSQLAEPGDELALVVQLRDVVVGVFQGKTPPDKLAQSLGLGLCGHLYPPSFTIASASFMACSLSVSKKLLWAAAATSLSGVQSR